MPDLLIRIKSKFDDKGFKQGEKSAINLGNALKGLAAGVAFAEVVQFGKESLDLAREQAAAEAQVAAAIASTGGAAGQSLRSLKEHASALQNITNFGDEATLAAQSQLLTFTKIGGETFPRATEAALDLATRMDGDLKGAVLQVGKALNDPIAGVTALTRSGVQFTDQQRDQIKALTESGKLLEAQNIILAELETQFGGSAEAAREADGGIIAMGNSFGDLREELGFLILDMNEATNATGLLDQGFQKLTAGAQAWQGNLDLFRDAGRAIGERVAPTIVKGVNAIAGAIGGEELQQKIKDFAQNYVAGIDEARAAQEEFVASAQTAGPAAAVDGLLDTRRALATDLIDQQRQTNDELEELADDRAEAIEDTEEDHADRVRDIAKRANKDRADLAKDLAKDLGRLNKDLDKALGKQQQDEGDRIAKLQKDSGRDEVNRQRRKKVDALADERLFQFELRQLAAEGDGIAIRDALERRAIEEEIAKEKASVEKDIEREKKQDQVASIREEGQERRAQLQLDNQERKQLLEERNTEELQELADKLSEDLAAEGENYSERRSELSLFYDERQEKIREGEAEGIAEIATGLATARELTRAELSQLAQLAFAFGQETGGQFSSGLTSGFLQNAQVDTAIAGGGGQADPLSGLTSGPASGVLPSQIATMVEAIKAGRRNDAQSIIDGLTEAMR